MTLEAEPSLVADSIGDTSSPPPPSHKSPALKRPARTYGRRRDALLDDDCSLVSSSFNNSRPNVYSTGPWNTQEEIPASSDDADAPPHSSSVTRRASDEDDGDNAPGQFDEQDDSSGFQFDWRKRLKEMDDNDDADFASSTPALKYKLTNLRSPTNKMQPANSASLELESTASTSLRDGPLSDLTDLSQSSKIFDSSPSFSLPARSAAHHKAKRVVNDSESDDERQRAAQSLRPSSPCVSPLPISPRVHLSSASPSANATVPPQKGKGKAPAADESERSSEDPSPLKNVRQNKRATRAKGKKSQRVKAPTKKEMRDTTVARHRLLANKPIFLPRETESRNVKDLLNKIMLKKSDKGIPLGRQPSELSDPIQPFSSSPSFADASMGEITPETKYGQPFNGQSQSVVSREASLKVNARVSLELPTKSDSDDELPAPSAVLRQRQLKQEAQQYAEEQREKLKALARMKERALTLQAQEQHTSSDGDDDDVLVIENDMQTVVKEEAHERQLRSRLRVSEGKKRQLVLGRANQDGSSPARQSGFQSEMLETLTTGKRSILGGWNDGGRKGKQRLSQQHLNAILLTRVQEKRAAETGKKEEEWERLGGKVVRETSGASGRKDVTEVIAEFMDRKAGKEAGVSSAVGKEELNSESDDEEWRPEERGSGSPEPAGQMDRSAETDENEEDASDEHNGRKHDDEDNEGADENENVVLPFGRRSSGRMVVDSDDDDDSNEENIHPGLPRASARMPTLTCRDGISSAKSGPSHRSSASSLGYRTEDETDKENDTRLMFDRSDDKENKAVVRYTASRPALGLLPRSDSLLSLEEGMRHRLSMSPGPLEDPVDDEPGEKMRAPFKELAKATSIDLHERQDEEDVFAFTPSQRAQKMTFFAERLQHSNSLQLSPSLPPLILGSGELTFSQDEEAENVFLKPALEPAFGDLFEMGTANPSGSSTSGLLKAAGNGREPEEGELRRLRSPVGKDEFSLTMDVGLKPALEISGSLLRKADHIFEKEQEFVIEAANRKLQHRPTLYVNDHGFLTQTRPDVSSPEIYRTSTPSQQTTVLALQVSQSSQRRPLRTLSLSEDMDDTQPLQRLRKRQMTPDGSPMPNPNPMHVSSGLLMNESSQKANVIGRLKIKSPLRPRKQRKPLQKSEFVEGEAVESDEDEMLGFGPLRGPDDKEEEDGEDQDANLVELIDDNAMDAETERRDLVLEKVKEHQEQDDAKNEKFQREVVDGKWKTRRRRERGAGFYSGSDDDSDDDDDDKRRRRKMNKKRKVEGDTLDELEQNVDTRAFVKLYKEDLVDDEDTLVFTESVVHSYGRVTVDGPEEQSQLEDEESERSSDEREVVTGAQVRQEIKNYARNYNEEELMDPDDVNWMDLDQSDEEIKIRTKEINLLHKTQPPTRRLAWGPTDFEGGSEVLHSHHPVESAKEKERLSSWAKSEGRTRKAGIGPSAVGAAVTGHKAKVQVGGGSLRQAGPERSVHVASAAETQESGKGLSILAALSHRTNHFA